MTDVVRTATDLGGYMTQDSYALHVTNAGETRIYHKCSACNKKFRKENPAGLVGFLPVVEGERFSQIIVWCNHCTNFRAPRPLAYTLLPQHDPSLFADLPPRPGA